MNNTISVVVASDNHYAILIAALLKSIEVNHKSPEHIDFYIIDDGISSDFKAKLNGMVDPARITIKWNKLKDIMPPDVSIPVDKSGFPVSAYSRIFSPYLVDANAERLIYLDVDTMIRADISELWKLDLGDHIIAAAQDPGETIDCEWGGIPNYAELGLSPKSKYFNSGVLLMNPKKWRENNITNEVFTALNKYAEHVKMADQYGLNVIFANKWLQLDPKWNWFAFKEDENPYLIHFLHIKPIFKTYHSQPVYKDEFFKYLALTPWKNFKPISGNRRNIQKVINRFKKMFIRR